MYEVLHILVNIHNKWAKKKEKEKQLKIQLPTSSRLVCPSVRLSVLITVWQHSTGVAKETMQHCQLLCLSVERRSAIYTVCLNSMALTLYEHKDIFFLWTSRCPLFTFSRSLLISLIPFPPHWLSEACQRPVKAHAVSHTLLPLMTSDDTYCWSHPLEITGGLGVPAAWKFYLLSFWICLTLPMHWHYIDTIT